MPEEYRLIIFSPQEALAAVAQHGKQMLPSGEVSRIDIEGAERTPTLLVATMMPNQQLDLTTVGTSVLAAALMTYCMRNSIPLPKRSAKSLASKNGKIALELRV